MFLPSCPSLPSYPSFEVCSPLRPMKGVSIGGAVEASTPTLFQRKGNLGRQPTLFATKYRDTSPGDHSFRDKVTHHHSVLVGPEAKTIAGAKKEMMNRMEDGGMEKAACAFLSC
jgi:hypothetical protein